MRADPRQADRQNQCLGRNSPRSARRAAVREPYNGDEKRTAIDEDSADGDGVKGDASEAPSAIERRPRPE